MFSFAVIIPAAGQSIRFGGGRSKLLESLCGQSVIAHAVNAFLCRADVSAVIVPTRDLEAISLALADKNGWLDVRIQFCDGGKSRAESVLNGTKCLKDDVEWVAVHDAARPLVSQELIDRTLAAAVEHGAAVPALAVHLTVKQARGPLPAKVERTIPRDALWVMQTPQVMRRAALLDAFE